MSDKIPDILLPALRQYQHNDCSGLLAGFDYNETVKIITEIEQQFVERACAAILSLSYDGGSGGKITIGEALKALREEFK